jgi:hypothetical protein
MSICKHHILGKQEKKNNKWKQSRTSPYHFQCPDCNAIGFLTDKKLTIVDITDVENDMPQPKFRIGNIVIIKDFLGIFLQLEILDAYLQKDTKKWQYYLGRENGWNEEEKLIDLELVRQK